MPLSKQDEQRIKEIDIELEKTHNNINEYHNRTDKNGVTWQTPGKPNEYQRLADRENELLQERLSITKRGKSA